MRAKPRGVTGAGQAALSKWCRHGDEMGISWPALSSPWCDIYAGLYAHILGPKSLLAEVGAGISAPLGSAWIPKPSGSLDNNIDSSSYYYLFS